MVSDVDKQDTDDSSGHPGSSVSVLGCPILAGPDHQAVPALEISILSVT